MFGLHLHWPVMGLQYVSSEPRGLHSQGEQPSGFEASRLENKALHWLQPNPVKKHKHTYHTEFRSKYFCIFCISFSLPCTRIYLNCINTNQQFSDSSNIASNLSIHVDITGILDWRMNKPQRNSIPAHPPTSPIFTLHCIYHAHNIYPALHLPWTQYLSCTAFTLHTIFTVHCIYPGHNIYPARHSPWTQYLPCTAFTLHTIFTVHCIYPAHNIYPAHSSCSCIARVLDGRQSLHWWCQQYHIGTPRSHMDLHPGDYSSLPGTHRSAAPSPGTYNHIPRFSEIMESELGEGMTMNNTIYKNKFICQRYF